MKPNHLASLAAGMLLCASNHVQAQYIPERAGVINLIPNQQSGEVDNNAEPSLAAGTGVNAGKFAVHTFSTIPGNLQLSQVFASSNTTNWVVNDLFQDYDATLAWSAGGDAYIAYLGYPPGDVMQVWYAGDPTQTNFNPIGTATLSGNLDQPHIQAVNVQGTDHIYIGYNNLGSPTGQTASVRFSLNGGYTWTDTTIEQIVPGGGQDSPATPVAVSPNGKTIYAAFQRWNIPSSGDWYGPVVLVRDDNGGLDNFQDLPVDSLGAHETLVAGQALLVPGATALGVQRIFGSVCAVAVNPLSPNKVYVAYTTLGANSSYSVWVAYSIDSGQTFKNVFNASLPSSLPALAVTSDGTVGLLYLATTIDSQSYEIHMFEAYDGNFSDTSDKVLATFPVNQPPDSFGQPYLGDYFDLKAVGHNFYGVFSASGNPQAANFPQGAYYQRNVAYGSTIRNNFSISTNGGQLVDLGGNPVPPSIDPFFFYDLAPSFFHSPRLEFVGSLIDYPGDNMAGVNHLLWPMLPADYPQFQLQSLNTLGSKMWMPDNDVTQSGGLILNSLMFNMPQQYYRLVQDVSGYSFPIFTSAVDPSTLMPNGVVMVAGGMNKTFTAMPMSGYLVDQWYLDGVPTAPGALTFTVSNVTAEHTLMVSYKGSNDLAVTVAGLPLAQGPVLVGNEVDYTVTIANVGSSLLTGITMTNYLDPTIDLLSASSSQVTLSTNVPGIVSGALGSLAPGAAVTVTIAGLPTEPGLITNTVTVACSQSEVDLTNNTASDVLNVLEELAITNQPQSLSVELGGKATFMVGATGTPPLGYQWYFDGVILPGETNSVLTLPDVTTTEAGSYTVAVLQIPAGPEDLLQVNSDPATLTVYVTAPVAITESPSLVTSNTAFLNGYVDPEGAATTYYFEYGTNTSYGATTSSGGVGIGGPQYVAFSVTGLLPSTTYHYRVDAYNSVGTNYGQDVSFTTLSAAGPPPAVVETLAATSITTNSAVLNGSIYGNGSGVASYFQYGLTTNYSTNTYNNQYFGSGNPTQDFGTEITGLAPATTYHYRIVGYNSSPNPAYGADMTFATLSMSGQALPSVTTLAASSISTTSAILNADVNPNGVETHAYFQYGTDTSYGSVTALEDLGAAGTSQMLQYALNFTAGTYHYRIVAYSAAGTNYGADVAFAIPSNSQPLPSVDTLAATAVTSSGGTLNATVNPNGAETHAYFQYGTNTSYGGTTALEDLGAGSSAQSLPYALNLASGTTYHYRIVAYNSAGTNYGADVAFTTPFPISPPSVQTDAAGAISSGGAQLNGAINPNGADTHVYFEYGTSTSYGSTTALEDVGALNSSQAFQATPTLSPNTTYHYQLVAYNSGGTSYGGDMAFTTDALAPEVTTLAATLITYSTADLNSTVDCNGVQTSVYFQYGFTTNYTKSTSPVLLEGGSQSYGTEVTGLIELTQYHFRVVAVNNGGTNYGADASFESGGTE